MMKLTKIVVILCVASACTKAPPAQAPGELASKRFVEGGGGFEKKSDEHILAEDVGQLVLTVTTELVKTPDQGKHPFGSVAVAITKNEYGAHKVTCIVDEPTERSPGEGALSWQVPISCDYAKEKDSGSNMIFYVTERGDITL